METRSLSTVNVVLSVCLFFWFLVADLFFIIFYFFCLFVFLSLFFVVVVGVVWGKNFGCDLISYGLILLSL